MRRFCRAQRILILEGKVTCHLIQYHKRTTYGHKRRGDTCLPAGVFFKIYFIPSLFQIAGMIKFFDITYQKEYMSDMS